MDNEEKNVGVIEWCCMCKNNGESADHLLPQCQVASSVWSNFFSQIDLAWVMPGSLVAPFSSWRGGGNPYTAAVWNWFLHVSYGVFEGK